MRMLPLELPLDPSPDQARDWLRTELANPEYGRNLFDEIQRWLKNEISKLTNLDSVSALGTGAVALLLLALVAGIAWWAWRARSVSRAKQEPAPVLGPQRLSAAQFREIAAMKLTAGDFDAALIAAFRAMAVDLVDRAILSEQPGRTAQELAHAAADRFPDQAAQLHQGAGWFDFAAYGLAPSPRSTSEQAQAIIALDRRLAASRANFDPVPIP